MKLSRDVLLSLPNATKRSALGAARGSRLDSTEPAEGLLAKTASAGGLNTDVVLAQRVGSALKLSRHVIKPMSYCCGSKTLDLLSSLEHFYL